MTESSLGAIFVICVFLLMIMTLGDPDIIDAIIYFLSDGNLNISESYDN